VLEKQFLCISHHTQITHSRKPPSKQWPDQVMVQT